jgi:RHS repeat-associated protein
MRNLTTLSLPLAGLLWAASLAAQANLDGPTPAALAPGSPISSYALGHVDHVNYFNGSLNIAVPLSPSGGRGDAIQEVVKQIQVRWLTDASTLAPVANGGMDLGISYSLGGYFTVESAYETASGTFCSNPSSPANGFPVPVSNVITWIVWHAPDGTETALADEATNGAVKPGSIDGCTTYDRGRVFHSYDGSSLTFVANEDVYDGGFPFSPVIEGTLYWPNGTQHVFVEQTSAPFWTDVYIRDRNGNQNFAHSQLFQAGCQSGGGYTISDSAGRTQTIIYATDSTCSTASDTITFPGSTQSGVQRTITVNYALLSATLMPGLPLGTMAHTNGGLTTKCLFPQLNGSTSTKYNPLVVSSIVLPDGSSYSFLYNYYGEVAQMTLPAGGVIKYTWPYPPDCSDLGNVSGAIKWTVSTGTIYRRLQERDEYANGLGGGLTGKTVFAKTSRSGGPDGNHTNRSGGFGTDVQVAFEDGSGNHLRDETHSFYGDPGQAASVPSDPTTYPPWSDGLEYQTQVAQSGTVRQTQQRIWQQQPCSGCWFNPASDTSARMNDPLVCQVNTALDSLPASTSAILTYFDFGASVTNNITNQFEYDFGSAPTLGATCPAIGSLPAGYFRQTLYSYWYASNPAYGPPTASALTNANLITLPAQKKVAGSDGSGSIDNYFYDQTALTLASGAPGHDDADFTISYTTRGNLTTHQQWKNEDGSYPAEAFTWDTTGRELSHTDFKSNVTGYSYSGDAAHIFPTTITNALSRQTTYTYDDKILQPLTMRDPNNVTTQYNYQTDSLDRISSMVRNYAGTGPISDTTYTYPSVLQTSVHQDQVTTGDKALHTDTLTDGLGRPAHTVVYETTSATITTDTAYDVLGRVTSVSNPYRPSDPKYYTDYTYDALNRTNCVATTFDSAQDCTTWSGNQATETDAAGHAKYLKVDAAGRLTSVTEDPGGLGYLTSYQYDALDNLKKVTQGSQTRTLTYDSRGNLWTAANPENGTTTYTYDANNNPATRTDNQGVVATYSFDALNRLSSITYAGARTAPSVAYSYDSGAGVTNPIGRLVSVNNGAGTLQKILGYDALGRITGSSETVGGTAAGTFGYTYNLADALATTTYPSTRVVTNAYDGANRIQSVTGAFQGTNTPYVSNATYAAFGGVGGFTYGSGRTRAFSYNGRTQLGEMNDQGAAHLDLKYYYGGAATTGAAGASTAANNGNPTNVVESALKGSGPNYTFTQTYGYDKANRLNTASDTGGWTQNFNYDQYGNPWTTANAGLLADLLPTSNVYTATTNHSTYIGTTYDAGGVGNQVAMGATTLTFDAENRIVQAYNSVSANSTCYGYDGLGQRVYKQTFGGNTCAGTAATTILYTYDAFGNLAAEHPSGTGTLTFPPCVTCYLTWDHLRSVRMVSDTLGGGYTGFHDYAPFGEEVLTYSGRGPDWGTSGNGTDYLNQRYTGAERDSESSLDFLQARYLANQQGRFVSADPAGNFVADPAHPQSWNLYSYAWSNPLAYLDPSGLSCITYDDGTQGDNNDGLGCPGAEVAPGNPDNPDTVTPYQVNVADQQGSWLNYFFSDLAGYTQPWLTHPQVYNPPITVYTSPGSKVTQTPRVKPTLAGCLLAPHDFVQQAYGGSQGPSDPLVGNNAAVPAGPIDVNKRRASMPKGNSNYVNAGGQTIAQSRALATVTVMNTISDCALISQ